MWNSDSRTWKNNLIFSFFSDDVLFRLYMHYYIAPNSSPCLQPREHKSPGVITIAILSLPFFHVLISFSAATMGGSWQQHQPTNNAKMLSAQLIQIDPKIPTLSALYILLLLTEILCTTVEQQITRRNIVGSILWMYFFVAFHLWILMETSKCVTHLTNRASLYNQSI